MLFFSRLRLILGTALFCAVMSSFSLKAETIVASHYGFLFNTAPIAVAIERGEFKKRGVDITDVISSAGGGTTMRNQIASGSGYGVVGTAAVLAAFREGHDIKIVSANVMSIADLFWVSMPGRGINSIQDLKGKKISYTRPRSTSETLAKMAVAAAGMKESDVELVSLGKVGAGLAALERGDVDAALILEPIWSGSKGKYVIAFDLKNLPNQTQTVGVTTAEFAKNNPDKLRAIIAARRAAVDYLYAEPVAAAKLVAKAYGDKVSEEVAINAVKNMVAINYWGRGKFDMPALNAMLDGLRVQGAWEGPIDWDKLIDQSFLPDDQKL
ncbi:MAG: NitT/TauT family transport system substrate-binding protein [Gammaproteobacteria bacterium]|jgi:NitT/TauT family transport system substrate-binding protein